MNAVRLAEVNLRTNGGFTVVLRLPGLALAGNGAEQLGLATPVFQDVPVGPAVWRKVGIDTVLLLGAVAVKQIVGTQEFASAEAVFESAAGLVVDGVFYTITSSEPIVAGGVPCGYRLAVLPPVRD